MLREILFFTWFQRQGGSRSASWIDMAIALCFVALLFIVRWRLKGRWSIRSIHHEPKAFLRIGIMLMFVGIVGGLSNDVAKVLNGGKMPINAVSGGVAANHATHVVASEDTRFLYLTDALVVYFSKLLLYLFPGYAHVSIGDLMIASAAIFSWWFALLTVLWAIYAVFKKHVSIL